jgi:cyanophycin synthetase
VTEAADIIEEALCIEIPASAALVLDDTRRLTGPGLLWDRPGAVLDVLTDQIDPQRIIALWRLQARRVLDAIGWQDEALIERAFDGGVSLAVSAPMDQLYSATFAAQTAWHFCACEILGSAPGDFATMIDDLRAVMRREANPALLTLIAAARERDLEALVDDDVISVGHGVGSRSWPVLDLPDVAAIDWSNLSDLPVALITGTNGKTTTTRLSCAIARAAGQTAGLTSTDMVSVGDTILDRGDYSGPGGARLLLRDQRVEIAYLEVARGGILRRGLPVRQARAALVTNIAADHLGQYGVNTVEDLALTKLAVHQCLAPDGVLILNADDRYLGAPSEAIDAEKWWFAESADQARIRAARAAGQPCAWLADNVLTVFDGEVETPVIHARDIPITMSGAATYNTMNALGAACLAIAMGLDFDAIRDGLRNFYNDPNDNPGRCNEFDVAGARVFVDFAHNPHSIEAVTSAMAGISAKRRYILLSHAGDRSDQDIRDVTASALCMKPDIVVATELPEVLRGRSEGEVSSVIIETCGAHGLESGQILQAASPLEATQQILSRLNPGDLALLLVLSERDQIFELLNAS